MEEDASWISGDLRRRTRVFNNNQDFMNFQIVGLAERFSRQISSTDERGHNLAGEAALLPLRGGDPNSRRL